WRFGEEAAVARAFERLEDGDLAFESKDRAVHDRYAMFHGRVVQEIPRGEVVGPIDHEVVPLDDAVDVRGPQALLVADDLHVRVQRLERALRGRYLRLADAVGRVQDLSLQIGEIDDIGVDDAEGADSRRREVVRGRRTEPARADEQHFALEELLLAGLADLGNEEVPRVPLGLQRREARRGRPRLAG